MKTFFYVSAVVLFLIVFVSRNFMFNSCTTRESTLKVLGKKSFLELETSVFKDGSFMKGNIVISEKITALVHNVHQETSFEKTLQSRADNSVVILSIVDSRYAKFALNLYKTSIERFDLRNYVMVCIDKGSFESLAKNGLHCVRYKTNETESSGDFGSLGYIQKTNLKTWIVLHALRLGYTVLVSDLDVVMFQNPFPYLTCEDCDLHVTRDRVHLNSGFIFVRPTSKSKHLYSVAWDLYQRYHKGNDQAYFNSAIQTLENEGVKIKTKELTQSTFQCGVYYFQEGGREFAGKPCPDCVMVHNNYLGSIAAKEYRFKENLLWMDDSDQYYSSVSAKYLTYENPYFFGDKTWEYEIQALKTALTLAKHLNRIVILPKFHCCQCEKGRCENERHRCSLLSVLNVKAFDAELYGLYREHVFLQNRLVPQKYKEIQQSQRLHLVKSQFYDNRSDVTSNSTLLIMEPKSASLDEIITFFSTFSSENVLQFHSLYGLSLVIDKIAESSPSTGTVPDEAFKCVNYEQWEVTKE